MKKIFALLALALLLPNISARADEEWTPAVPIRMGKIRGQILKNFVERDGKGSISVRSEEVCNFDASIPVYDVRGRKEYYSPPSTLSCDSTYQGRPIHVGLTGFISIANRKISGEDLDVKGAALYIFPFTDGNTPAPVPNSLTGSAGSRDLSTKSFILDVDQMHSGDPSLPKSEETFAATAELSDDAQ